MRPHYSPSFFVFLTDAEVRSLVSLPEAMLAVAKSFIELAQAKAHLFPVVRERVDPYDGFFGIKSGYLSSEGILGCKSGGFWKNNAASSLAAHQSIILLFDPATGVALAGLAGNYLTAIRTAVAGALAAKHLARPESKTVAMIGTGAQARAQLEALREVLPIEEVRCCAMRQQSAERFAVEARNRKLRAEAYGTPNETIKNADVIVTTTPAFEPIVLDSDVRPGVHINAIGADTRGKQEIATSILRKAKIVVDYFPQARVLGECQHAFQDGSISGVFAELGEILAGLKPGRENDQEITLFDATGIAAQDLAVAGLAYRRALALGIGTRVKYGG